MAAFVARRTAYMLVVLFIASVVVFLALRITPGDSTNFVITPISSPERFEEIRRELGLDRPLAEQFVTFWSRMLSGEFGDSAISRRPVVDVVASGLPYTLALAFVAGLLVYGIGIPWGIIAAKRRDGLPDKLASGFAVVGLGIPNFVLALLLVMLFSITLGWLPPSGAATPAAIILPAIVLAIEPIVVTMRLTRSSALEQLSQDYVRTLAAKGLSRRRIVWVHVLRNALGPVIALSAVQVRTLLGYALVVEVIFRWPGLGYQLVDAVLKRDYLVAQVLALMLTFTVIVLNTLADIAYAYVDPKVRAQAVAA
jgi:peptide/nickel transport system permease protein